MNYETANEIELAIAKFFGIRKYVIVPNVSWGFLQYEADMLILTSSLYAWEVEIKVSVADLLRDQHKRHSHDSPYVRRLWFAIPECLESSADHIPFRAGILVVKKNGKVVQCRKPKILNCRKLSETDSFKIARLGVMRIWSLKEKIINMTTIG